MSSTARLTGESTTATLETEPPASRGKKNRKKAKQKSMEGMPDMHRATQELKIEGLAPSDAPQTAEAECTLAEAEQEVQQSPEPIISESLFSQGVAPIELTQDSFRSDSAQAPEPFVSEPVLSQDEPLAEPPQDFHAKSTSANEPATSTGQVSDETTPSAAVEDFITPKTKTKSRSGKAGIACETRREKRLLRSERLVLNYHLEVVLSAM